MKKVISVILVIATLFCAFPMSYAVSADEIEQNQFSDLSEDVFYTDLFSVYSQYLLDDGLTDTMDEELQEALITVYENLKYSEKYYDIVNKHTLTNIGDITFLVKLVSDATGATNFSYNEALDTANQLLVNSMFSKSYVGDSLQSNGRMVQIINICKEVVVELMKDVKIIYKKEIDVISLADILNVVTSNEGKYYSYFGHYYHKWGVKEVVDYCSVNVEEVKGIFSSVTSGIEMFSAIILAFSMEMMRAEIIEDLIAVSDEGSAINDGMSRLSTQLVDGAVSYFIHNYIKKEGIKRFENAVDTFVSDKILDSAVPDASFVLTVVNIAATITYDLILDVPDFSELTAYIILARYSQELAQCIKKMEESFTNTPLNGHTITRYENLWCVYNAANKAVWKLGNDLAIEKDKNTLDFAFSTYYTPNIDFYTEKMNFVIDMVERIPVEERNIVPASAYIYNANSIGATLRDATDEMVEDNCIYTVNGYLYGDLRVNSDCNMSVLQDTKGVYGSIDINSYTLTVGKDSEYTVGGDVVLSGVWRANSFYEGILAINGKLTVHGDVYTTVDYTMYDFYMSEEGELWLYGDFNAGTFIHNYGTIYCVGKEQQGVGGEICNLVVYNTEGIKGDISLNGRFDLCGNPFDGIVYLYEGGSFADGSNYKDVRIQCTKYTMRSNIPADSVTAYGIEIEVSKGESYVIGGDLYLGGYLSGTRTYKGVLNVYGELTVNGDISKTLEDNNYYEVRMLDEDSVLRLKGDQNIGVSSTGYGLVVFFGDEQQRISGNHKDILVLNEEGVAGDISLYGYFALSGNPHEGRIMVNNGCAFDDSVFDCVSVQNNNCTMKSNIYAKTLEIYRATLTVPEGEAYTIGADIILGGYMYGYNTYYGILDIKGDLSVKGDISNMEGNNYYKINTYNGSVIRFCGNDAQTIKPFISGYTVALENGSDEGVIFEAGCSANTLFDHNRNNYSIKGTGIFTDYDKDGIIDSEDMVPEAAKGDVDCDGFVNAIDANAISRITSGRTAYISFEAAYNSDLNGDGLVNSMDSNVIKRILVGA